jgi:hypothetical protein
MSNVLLPEGKSRLMSDRPVVLSGKVKVKPLTAMVGDGAMLSIVHTRVWSRLCSNVVRRNQNIDGAMIEKRCP